MCLRRSVFLLVVMVVVVTLALTRASEEGQEGVEVALVQGVVRGVALEAGHNRTVYAFRGLPYAQPPVGPLRFKDPVAASGWSGVREEFRPPPCPQLDVEKKLVGEEDCLYLHVYTPRPYESDLPVMVYVHGGGFNKGYPDAFGGSPLPLLTKDVVLVTLQYRLGVLGFLSTGDEVLPGNMGLKDQTAALRWVRDNIGRLGGDPNRVTLFGESAGAASAEFHLLSPHSQGLVHRIILQSGSALSPWAVRSDHREVTVALARLLDCPGGEDSRAILSCLQNANIHKLMYDTEKNAWCSFPRQMVVRVDGDFLPAAPAQLLREGRYARVPVISGVNQDEAAYIIAMCMLMGHEQRLVTRLSEAGPISMQLHDEHNAQYLAQRILYHFVGTQLNFTLDTAEPMLQVLSNVYFNVPHDLGAQLHARDAVYGAPTFLYQLHHRAQYTFTDFLQVSTSRQRWVSHVDDLMYLFDYVFGLGPLRNPDDLMLRRLMLDLWTNFAATGNPTPDLSLGFVWRPATPTSLHHLRLSPAPTMASDTRSQVREFLSDLPTRQNQQLFPHKFCHGSPASCPQSDHCPAHFCHGSPASCPQSDHCPAH